MIHLDKSLDTHNVVLTLTELATIDNPIYFLVLTNDFTKAVTAIRLGENLSLNTNRYDLFQLTTDLVNSLEAGLYSYSAFQSNSPDSFDNTASIEDGKALVIDPSLVEQQVSYNSNPTEYITYSSAND